MDKYIPIITVPGNEDSQYFLTKTLYPYEDEFWLSLPMNIYSIDHALTLSEAEDAITWWTTKALNNEKIMPTSIQIKKVD